jgi:4-amino-4-deoxy-L-arabinose transferase-like glycosyltransferase
VLAFVLLIRVATALPLQQPGYMDAYYYYNVAESLLRGDGFTDRILWNFLDGPVGLPHPACLYWMPLTAAVIYPFFLLLGMSFKVAQIPFILLATVLAWLAYRVSFDLSGRRDQAILSLLLAAFSGFYTVFWVTTDSFALFAVVAGLALYTAGRGLRELRPVWFILSGIFAGLSHLSRADGVLVFVAVILVLFLTVWRRSRPRIAVIICCLSAVMAYFIVMAPWFYRNWQLTGTFLGISGFQTLFLRGYDELFSYSQKLTPSSYLAWGLPAILNSKLHALWFGFQNLLAVNLLIFLAPLSLWGLWMWRRKIEVLPFAIYGTLLYVAMTLFFTFPGMRGGLFHSSAALLPWFFAGAACGLEQFIRFMSHHRSGWHYDRTYSVFFAALIVFALFLSGFLYAGSLGGDSGRTLPWNERNAVYSDVGDWLKNRDQNPGPVMVNNAPGFYYYTDLPSISIPTDDLETVLVVARRYGVTYLVLESEHPGSLQPLYEAEQTDRRLTLEVTMQDRNGLPVKIYRVET